METIRHSKGDDGVSLNDSVEKKTEGGLNVLTTSVFVVGVIAGAEFLAFPKAIGDSGWIGFLLVVLCFFLSAYTGDILGKCWTIVRERHPGIRNGKVRYPYTAIGEEAYGKWGSTMVSFSINLTMFGSTAVYLLLAAEDIGKLLPPQSNLTCCHIALIVCGIMTPFTWLGTPKDFWGIAARATLATSTAAYKTICSAYIGHPTFPTFQSDMTNSKKFGSSLALGYLIVFVVYMPCSIAAYVVYGEKIEANIVSTVPGGPATTMVSLLMTANILFGIVYIINPLSHQLEHVLNIPEHFTWKRILSRSSTMLAVLLLAESVPHISSLLSLIGGSTVLILAFVCPPLFYLKLSKGNADYGELFVPLHTKVLLYEVMLIGVTAGVAATYSAITDLAVNKFTVPCYVDAYRACHR